MKAGVLCVQGAFAEHEQVLSRLGVETVELRQKKDLLQDMDFLVLPGGESTVMRKLLKELDMFDSLKEKIGGGLPVFATCAGLILLAEGLSNDPEPCFGTLPVTVRRNAYGRQTGSFFTESEYGNAGKVPMTFIRAPFVEKAGDGVEVLSVVDGNIVAVRHGHQTAISFHPELNTSTAVYEEFIAHEFGC